MFRSLVPCVLLLLGVAPAPAADAPSFEKDILPLLKDRCFSCHGIDKPKGGLDLRTRASLLKGGRNGPALVPGSLKESLLWLNVSTDKMPADKRTVSDPEKDLLRRWILAGAPGEGVAAAIVKRTQDGASEPLLKRGPAAVAARIDEEIGRRLNEAKQSLGPTADDAEFLRRVFLDLTGRIPSIERATAFLDSKESDKRSKLVEELLDSPDYGRHFASIWSKVITAEEPNLKAGLEKWLTERFNQNRAWDALVRDLLTATGTGPETAFVMSNVENKIPQSNKLTGSMARLFLGVQLQCAECHNHPFVDWKQTDFWGLAAFFTNTRVAAKTQPAGVIEAEPPAPKGKTAEPLKGAVIVLPVSAGRGAGKSVTAKFLEGDQPKLDPRGPFRPALAAWLTSTDNPFFAKAAANRLWAHFMGRGFINPIDDLSDDNPSTHPAAFQALADEFRASGFDLKHLIRCICATKAYQRSSKASSGSKDDNLYGRMAAKVMSPEALYDSLVLALGVKEISIRTGVVATGGTGGTNQKLPARERFIRFFGTGDPEGYATDYSHGIPQALSLMNDPSLAQKPPLLERLAKADPQPEKVIEGLYLALLTRRPTESERKTLLDYVTRQSEPMKGYSGVLWVLINTPEFVLVR